ncbi:GNAT family N-acetyltransferase [Bremerella sp. P1]|uniref:GNAT family N-acetyltransferase n=1 Tax=Bremerella sp. P1 TaxID=3026424 RepID=UPI002368D55F|nr:GNAT family N-acetyltransferase [Bremerella sp. P1]WDI42682.1 GNAT family N-acetyltransferase [Bremerella sp. P1]
MNPNDAPDHPEIGAASPEHYGAALWMATGGRSRHAHRGRVTALLAAEKQGKISFDGLMTATRGNRVVSSIWCLSQPGKIGTVWGPGILSEESDSTADLLIQQAVQFAKHHDCHLLQSLVGPENRPAGNLLAGCGFQSITLLSHLEALTEDVPAEPPHSDLQFRRCDDFQSEAFRNLVAQTYENSLDCPELDGMRDVADVLEGYHATSNKSTYNWYTLENDGEMIGVVITAHHAEPQQLELIYFGLTPRYRQLGLGKEILRFVLQLAQFLGCRSTITGVDQRNTPAIALYRRFGFEQASVKELFLLPLRLPNIAVA